MSSLMRSTRPHPAIVFAGIFVVIFLLHLPVLQLPYFWDEAGYYVPAARDLLLGGSLIPHTTASNAHPPLVLAWIALWWKCVGYAPVVTRSAMLMVAAFSLLGVFRLAQRVANTQVAIASTLCTALYSVFFAQSSLAQVDLAAAGLTFWGLCAYLGERSAAVAIWFSLAAVAKETAILAPLALACWEILRLVAPKDGALRKLWTDPGPGGRASKRILPLLFPLLPLALWYTYHWARTGYVFGNPEFFRYNVAATLNPLRFLLALVLRLWQAFGYMHLWVLTLGMLLALMLPPVKDSGAERSRIAIPLQMVFLVVVKVYVVALALIGGAVLARYMLPAVPLVIIVGVSTLRRRLRYWPAAVVMLSWSRSHSSQHGSGIRPTDSRQKTILPTATPSFCIRTANVTSKPAIRWRTRSRHGRLRTNSRGRGWVTPRVRCRWCASKTSPWKKFSPLRNSALTSTSHLCSPPSTNPRIRCWIAGKAGRV
jgi:hypothetical protein